MSKWEKIKEKCCFDKDGELIQVCFADEYINEIEGLLLWALYHHQGGKSEIGQPIRKLLGIGQFDNLTDEQIARAKEHGDDGGVVAIGVA